MIGTIFITILLLLVLLTAMQLFSMYRTHRMDEIVFEPSPPQYFPTKEWQISSPEAQGMSSTKLLEMIDFYKKQKNKNEEILIDSLTVIRNEQIVADLYFNPLFPKNKKHIINSCTKSVMGILMGIAIEKGFVKNVNVPILHFFDDINLPNKSKRLESLTIKNLLTMRTGWHSRDSYLYQWAGIFKMQTTENWTEYILNLPFETNPDSRFDYSNMASFLLSAIIAKASGMDTLSFAKKYLFTPLGIKDFYWEKSPEGVYVGFARMWLKPHDMAKIGLLFLQKGKWEDQQIVSQSWVEDSIKAYSFPQQYRYIYNEKNKIDFKTSGGNWVFSNLVRPFTDGYGYQWWLDKSGIFTALGVGGQFIMVAPKEELIVVATSKLKSKDTFLPVVLLKKFILPAIESNTPIPTNETAHKKLLERSNPSLDSPEVIPVLELPKMAQRISGKRYSLEKSIKKNPWQIDNLKLEFDSDLDYVVFSYSQYQNQKIQYEVRLNNQYRTSDFNSKSYAAVGEWTDSNTFTINYEMIGYASKGKWILKFINNHIEVIEVGVTGENNYNGIMKEVEVST